MRRLIASFTLITTFAYAADSNISSPLRVYTVEVTWEQKFRAVP